MGDRPHEVGIARHAVRTAFRAYRARPLAIGGIAAAVFAPVVLYEVALAFTLFQESEGFSVDPESVSL
jgi:hypothetical protein